MTTAVAWPEKDLFDKFNVILFKFVEMLVNSFSAQNHKL